MKTTIALAALVVLAAAPVHAEDLVCRGSITSIQGEGLVARTHRFDVERVAGADLVAVLEKCRQIARERQLRAARRSPGGNFRKSSEIDLLCVKGEEKFPVKRSIGTAP